MDKKTAIKSLQMQQMFSTSNASLATSTLLAAILAYVQYKVIASTVVFAWLSLIVLLTIIRTVLVSYYLRSPVEEYSTTHARIVNYRLGVMISGCVWGSASFLMFPANDSMHQLFLVFMLAGLTAGGVVSYSADLVSTIGFSVATLAPLVIRLFVAGDSLSVAMGMAIALYLGFMILSGRIANRHISDNIVLRLEASSREKDIRASENRYRLLLRHSPVGIFHYDNNLVITYCNDNFANILKCSVDRIVGMDMMTLKDQSVLPSLKNALNGEISLYEGHYHATLSDANIWIAMICAPSRDDNEKVIGGIAIVQDITERKLAEQNQNRLARALKLLSKCDSVLVRAESEQELLSEICQLTVEIGGYMMAWVGFAENDANKTVRAAAQSGYEDGYLDSLNVTWADTAQGWGPVGTAIREGITVVIQDFHTNPKMAPWSEAAFKRGYNSCIALPLVVNKQALGALAIYSTEPFAFGKEEVELLEQLANDLGFGIQTLRTRFEYEEARVSLKVESEMNLALLHNASDGIHILDAVGNVIEASDSFCAMLGYQRDETIGMNVSQWDDKFKDAKLAELVRQLYAQQGRSQFETRHRRKDGATIEVEVSSFPLELGGKPVLFCSSRDITERKAAEEQIRNLAFYDALTQLPNRRLLNDRLGQLMAASKRSGHYGALMFLDLDNFKPLNDTYGHGVGDLLLIEAARRINSCVREVDTVARLGGDEFVVMLSELDMDKAESTTQADIVAEKIRASLAEPYLLTIQQNGNVESTIEYHCTSSIGVVVFFNHEASSEDLLKWADKAMYQAKEDGRNLIRFFNPQGNNDVRPVNQDAMILRLNWHESYDCGESTIDQEHRELFDLANTLIKSAFTRDENPQKFDTAMEKLLAHVVQHFADEEAILARHHFIYLGEHAHAHKTLVAHAIQLRNAAAAGGVTIGELVNFLAGEVVSQHMLKEDRKFYPLFNEARPS